MRNQINKKNCIFGYHTEKKNDKVTLNKKFSKYNVIFQGPNTVADNATVTVSFLPNSASQFPTITGPTDTNIILSETRPTTSPITTITANSPRGNSASLTYHIAGGNTGDTFMVDQQGKVMLKHPLDYEEVKSFNLWVEVRDETSSPERLSDYLGLTIQVTDANDSPPVFDKLYYNASVNEVDQPPVVVTTVTASDADSEEFGKITYELVGGNQLNHFAIDSTGGEIRTQVKLDREQISAYKLVVTATDHVSLCVVSHLYYLCNLITQVIKLRVFFLFFFIMFLDKSLEICLYFLSNNKQHYIS